MIVLHNTLVSDEIKEIFFCCDLRECKGACCVEGDGGAPLEEEEISFLEDHIDSIKPYMEPEGIGEVEKTGVFDYDEKGNFVTPLVNGNECCYVSFEGDVARCAIEKAFQEKAIPFPKPLSCHLYPIRIRKVHHGDGLNYHKWHICRSALRNGKKRQIPLYKFLEGSLVRKYGRGWYEELINLLD